MTRVINVSKKFVEMKTGVNLKQKQHQLFLHPNYSANILKASF